MCPWRKHYKLNQHDVDTGLDVDVVDVFPVLVAEAGQRKGGRAEKGRTHINKQVLPQAPSPTMTSFRRISAMAAVGGLEIKLEGTEMSVGKAGDGCFLLSLPTRGKDVDERRRTERMGGLGFS